MITINKQPYFLQPVYNNASIDVISDIYNQNEFKYLFETYINNELINTSPLFPRPNHNAIFDCSKILKNYTYYEFNNNITSICNNFDNEIQKNKVDITETYTGNMEIRFYDNIILNNGDFGFKIDSIYAYLFVTGQTITIQQDLGYTYSSYNTGTTIKSIETGSTYTNIGTYITRIGDTPVDPGYILFEGIKTSASTSTFYSYQAVAQWEASKNLSGYSNSFLPNVSTPSNLFGTLNNKLTVNTTDKRVLSCFQHNFDSLKVHSLRVNTYTGKQFIKILPILTGLTYDNAIMHIPIGLTELNALDWNYSGSTLVEDDKQLTITLTDNGGNSLFKPFVLNISNCAQFDNYTVMYKSQNGSYWYINMNKKSVKGLDIQTTNYQHYLSYNINEYSNQYSTNNIISRGKYILKSDWLRNQEEVSEYIDMLQSPDVYLLNNNIKIPVSITTKSIEEKNIHQNKLIMYEIEFSESFDKNTLI